MGAKWDSQWKKLKLCSSQIRMNLKLYGNNLERVECFSFLGVHFDSRLTWREHIRSIAKKCKGVINVMRCLEGLERGTDITPFLYIYM